VPDLDLLDYLSADHSVLGALEGKALESAVETHLTVERALLYPAIEAYLEDGKALVRRLLANDRQVEAVLADTSATFDGGHDPSLRTHIEAHEALVERLRADIPAATLVELGDQVGGAIADSPTHPHPRLPDHGPLRAVASELAGVADRIRDRLEEGRRD
jgi:hypothetical protein